MTFLTGLVGHLAHVTEMFRARTGLRNFACHNETCRQGRGGAAALCGNCKSILAWYDGRTKHWSRA